MSMIRKAAATFAALALSAGLMFGSALWGAAASQVEVTYKVPFFQDTTSRSSPSATHKHRRLPGPTTGS